MAKKTAPKKTAPVEEQDVDLEEEAEDGLDQDVESEEIEEDEEAPAPEKPNEATKTTKDELVFVNKEKHARAKDIVALVTGKRVPRETSELERKDHYTELLKARGVKGTDPIAVQAIYEILGGLVRTPSEQAQAEANAAKAKAKNKKKKIED